jgi:hypothetical protein
LTNSVVACLHRPRGFKLDAQSSVRFHLQPQAGLVPLSPTVLSGVMVRLHQALNMLAAGRK